MRIASILALFALFALPARAQTPEPDTTDWHTYLPLEIGNEWHYEYRGRLGVHFFDLSYTIVGDSLVDGTAYFVARHCREEPPNSEAECWPLELVRYDEDAAAVLRRREVGGGVEYKAWPGVGFYCRLDLPFSSGMVECFEGSQPYLDVSGTYGTTVVIGGDTSLEGTHKDFFTGFGATTFLSGTGMLADSFEDDLTKLVFARVGGAEYGGPVVTVATEAPPVVEEASLTVHPNPLRDAATLSFLLERTEALTLKVYDIQGRRVRAVTLGVLGAGTHAVPFGRGDLPSGAYGLRLVGDGGFAATRGVIIHR